MNAKTLEALETVAEWLNSVPEGRYGAIGELNRRKVNEALAAARSPVEPELVERLRRMLRVLTEVDAKLYQNAIPLNDKVPAVREDLQTIRDAIAALTAIHPQAEGETGWRPIETAPKDGTLIDLWAFFPEHQKARRIADASWDAEADAWRFGPGGFLHTQLQYPPEIKSWRPLPAPPHPEPGEL